MREALLFCFNFKKATEFHRLLVEQLGVSQVAISMRLHARGRFKRSENGCRMNWTIGRWSDTKTHAKFCLPDKKENRSCVGLWQAMKNGSIFRILNVRNWGWSCPTINIFLKTKSLRTENAVRLVRSGGCHLLRAVKTWKPLMLTATTVNSIVLCVKKGRIIGRYDKLIFLHDNAPSHNHQQWSKTTWRHSTEKCYSIPLTH